MSLKGTPYYSMALDAGASEGDEAEQMAQIIYHDHMESEMTWLSAIEKARLISRRWGTMPEDMDRMARVTRELVRFIRVLRATDDQREIAIAYDDICSPDAKELIDEPQTALHHPS